MSAVLSIADSMEAAIDLHFDNFANAFIFELLEALGRIFTLLDAVTFIQELFGPEERA